MTYLIAAIVMTSNVLEGHFPIASLYKCDFFRIYGVLYVPSAFAELLVKKLGVSPNVEGSGSLFPP